MQAIPATSAHYTEPVACVADLNGPVFVPWLDRNSFLALGAERLPAAFPFCGVGMLALACQRTGCFPTSAADRDNSQRVAFQENFGVKAQRSVASMLRNMTRKSTAMVACGFPCTPWAASGAARGMSDPTNMTSSVNDFLAVIATMKKLSIPCFFGENVPNLAWHNGGKDLDAILTSLRSADYVVIHGFTNPRHWGAPEDRTRLFILGLRKDIADAVHFSDFSVLSRPLKPVTTFKSIDDILQPDTPNAARGGAKYIYTHDANDPSITWVRDRDSIPAHDRASPAKAITLGYVKGGTRTGHRIVSSHGAVPTITAAPWAEGPGRNQCLVFIHSRNLIRTLCPFTELSRIRNLGKRFTLSKDPQRAVQQIGLGLHPFPVSDNVALLAACYHNFLVLTGRTHRASPKVPRPITFRLVNKFSVITPQLVGDFNKWCFTYAAATVRFRIGVDKSFKCPSFEADMRTHTRPECWHICWDLRSDIPVPLARLVSTPLTHAVDLSSQRQWMTDFDDKDLIMSSKLLGFGSASTSGLSTLCHPNHKGFLKDEEVALSEIEKEIDGGKVVRHSQIPFWPMRINPMFLSFAKPGRPRLISDYAFPRDGTEINASVRLDTLSQLKFIKHSHVFDAIALACAKAVCVQRFAPTAAVSLSVTDLIGAFRTGNCDILDSWLHCFAFVLQNAADIMSCVPRLDPSMSRKDFESRLLQIPLQAFIDAVQPIQLLHDLYMNFGLCTNPWNWNRMTRGLVHIMSAKVRPNSTHPYDHELQSQWRRHLSTLSRDQRESLLPRPVIRQTSGHRVHYDVLQERQYNSALLPAPSWEGIPDTPHPSAHPNPIFELSAATVKPDLGTLNSFAGLIDDFLHVCVSVPSVPPSTGPINLTEDSIPADAMSGITSSVETMRVFIRKECTFPHAESVRDAVVRPTLEESGCEVVSTPKGRKKYVQGMSASCIVYLGVCYDVRNATRPVATVPEGKRLKILVIISSILEASTQSVEYKILESLAGKLVDVACIIKRGRLWLFGLFAALKQHGTIWISDFLRQSLRFWKDLLFLRSPVTLVLTKPAAIVSPRCDASNIGIGGWWKVGDTVYYFFDVWTTKERALIKDRKLHINKLELQGIAILLYLCAASFSNQCITILCDNKSSVDMCQNMKAKTSQAFHLLFNIDLDLSRHSVESFFDHIIGEENIEADHLSRDELEKFFLSINNQFANVTFHKVAQLVTQPIDPPQHCPYCLHLYIAM